MTKYTYTTDTETDSALQAGLDDHNVRLGEDNPGLLTDAGAFFEHLVNSQMAQIRNQYGKVTSVDADKVEGALVDDPVALEAFIKLRAEMGL